MNFGRDCFRSPVLLVIALIAMVACGPRTELERAARDLKSNDPAIRVSAARALGELKSAEAARLLLDALSDSDSSVRAAAADGLKSCAPSAVELLLGELQRSDSRVREPVIKAIAPLKDPRTISLLVAVMRSGSAPERKAAAEAVGGIGSAAYESVAALQNDADAATLAYMALALGMIADARAVPILLGVLQNPNSAAQLSAVEALGRFREPKVVEALLPMLDVKELREAAVASLGSSASSNVQSLSAGYKGRSTEGKLGLIRALARTGSADAVHAIAAILRQATAGEYPFSDDNTRIQEQAEKSFAQIGPTAVAPLLEILRKGPDVWVSGAISGALRESVDLSTIQLVIDEMMAGRSEVSVHDSALALASIATQTTNPKPAELSAKALTAVLAAFDSDKPTVRQKVASAVEYNLNPAIEKKLLEAFGRKDSAVIAGAHKYFIEKALPNSEDTLIEALNKYGDWLMGEAYLNCGNERLEKAAKAWAARNGFVVKPSESGFRSASWGSNR